MLRYQTCEPLYHQPGPHAPHQVLEHNVGAQQPEQHGHQGPEPGPPRLGEKEHSPGDHQPHESRIPQLCKCRKKGVQYGTP